MCGKFTVATAVVKPAPSKFQTTGYANEVMGYYCGACDKFHHVKQEAQAVVRGPVNARALLSASRELDGHSIIRWSVGDQSGTERTVVQTVEFYPWPRRYPMTETEPLIYKTWQLLMQKVEIIMGGKPDPWDAAQVEELKRYEEARQQARGIAEVLAIQMKPFMESADHVVRCAVAYHKDPWFEVPGLGAHLWDPMKNPDGSDRVPISSPRAERKTTTKKVSSKPKPPVSTTKLTDKEREGIREAMSSGMFTEEDVAGMFKVSLSEVKSALA